MARLPSLPLNDGHSLPALGLGLWQVPAADTARVVEQALGLGYLAAIAALDAGERTGLDPDRFA